MHTISRSFYESIKDRAFVAKGKITAVHDASVEIELISTFIGTETRETMLRRYSLLKLHSGNTMYQSVAIKNPLGQQIKIIDITGASITQVDLSDVASGVVWIEFTGEKVNT
jgi:hypothetical protein